MYQSGNKSNSQSKAKINNTHWIDSVDMELIFMNSIAICIVLLAIVAADMFMT